MSADPAARQPREKEFVLSERDFNKIRTLVKDKTGINLSEGKRDMVYSRLSRRLRQLNYDSFKDYLQNLQTDEVEIGNFINAITTNLTSFFRENHHFEYLAKTVIPSLLKSNADTGRIRIWSAGCSTGEEPYSIAMTVLDAIPDISRWDVKILATDLDTNVVAHAKAGVYAIDRVKDLPANIKRKYFRKERGENVDTVRIAENVKQLITFKQLNLMHDWPMSGPFDLIFCRNVVIYFDKPTQRILFDRYADLLRPDGHINLGHSESLFKVSDRFKLLGNTMYQRIK